METDRIIYNLYFYSLVGAIQINGVLITESTDITNTIRQKINTLQDESFNEILITIDNAISDQIYLEQINNKYAK